MAKAPKEKKEKKAEETKSSFDPFANVASSKGKKAGSSTLGSVAGTGVGAEIDNFVKAARQIKDLESEKSASKDTVMIFANQEFAKRQRAGQSGNFRIEGNSESVTFIAQAKGSALAGDTMGVLKEKWGIEVVAAVTEVDLSSLKFNPEIIGNAELQQKIFAALENALTKEVRANLFLPVTYKVKTDVLDVAPTVTKTATELAQLYSDLKLTSYIRS